MASMSRPGDNVSSSKQEATRVRCTEIQRAHGVLAQELRAFLELEGSLGDSYQWRQLHPLQCSLMEGLSRLPKQLLGAVLPSSRVRLRYS